MVPVFGDLHAARVLEDKTYFMVREHVGYTELLAALLPIQNPHLFVFNGRGS